MCAVRRRAVLAAAIAVVLLVAALHWHRVSGPTRSTRLGFEEKAQAEPAAIQAPELAPPENVEDTREPERGVIVGRLTYEDGSPAAQLPVNLEYGHHPTTSDAEGGFRIAAQPGRHQLRLNLLVLETFELRPGQEHVVNRVVPRGAEVSGKIVAAEDGRPLGDALPRVEGAVVFETFARKDGTFEFGWVPNGSYHVLARTGSRRTEVAAFDVASTAVELSIKIPEVIPLRLRFENVPPEWREEIPLFVDIHDEAKRLLTSRPSNRIGGLGGPRSIDLDAEGRPCWPLPTPVPGKHVLSLRHLAWDVPYLEVPIESPACGRDEVVVRIPDGARVVVSQVEGLSSGLGRLGGIAIGPACEYLGGQEKEVTLPRVPAGHHTIWKTSMWSVVRIGEIEVPTAGDVRYVVPGDLSARIVGEKDGDEAVRLYREADDLLVAWADGSGRMEINPLAPGRYVLVVDARRIPIELNPHDVIDLGEDFDRR